MKRCQLTCPKCGGRFFRYERTGIVVERCDGCAAIFLDQGELERLVEAEGAILYGGTPEAMGPKRRIGRSYPGRLRIPVTERMLGRR